MFESDRSDFQKFLSYYPLKQGLKHVCPIGVFVNFIKFLSYYPLKQGLKRNPETI